MCEINKQADQAVNEMLERYAEALQTIEGIIKSAREFDIDKESQNAQGFAGWMKSQIPYIEHELVKRHKVEL